MQEPEVNAFFEHPILNSPYSYPDYHWELDATGQPTQRIINSRRQASFFTPIPKPKKQKGKGKGEQLDLLFNANLDTQEQQYDQNSIINSVRSEVDKWRNLPSSAWRVTPETARLLDHWRNFKFSGIRPFFCQVEAVEVVIYLTEVAPQTKEGRFFLDHLTRANHDANPEIMRLALKLATGAGKTTVMAMIIAWQTINSVRRPTSKKFTRGFLITTPGLTIKDRLRVLKPNDPDSYYKSRELVPEDMLDDLNKAKIVITNYHAYKLRKRIELSKGGRALLQGRTGENISTIESEGQMLQRVMPELMGMKGILAINDEAHHCYRAKPEEADDVKLKGDDKAEAQNAHDFLECKSGRLPHESSYRLGLRQSRLDNLVPEPTRSALANALRRFDRLAPGFIRHGLLVGMETRVSSPVRFLRDPETLASSMPGLWLGGEGGGMAGGIVSAAIDGIRLAEKMLTV